MNSLKQFLYPVLIAGFVLSGGLEKRDAQAFERTTADTVIAEIVAQKVADRILWSVDFKGPGPNEGIDYIYEEGGALFLELGIMSRSADNRFKWKFLIPPETVGTAVVQHRNFTAVHMDEIDRLLLEHIVVSVKRDDPSRLMSLNVDGAAHERLIKALLRRGDLEEFGRNFRWYRWTAQAEPKLRAAFGHHYGVESPRMKPTGLSSSADRMYFKMPIMLRQMLREYGSRNGRTALIKTIPKHLNGTKSWDAFKFEGPSQKFTQAGLNRLADLILQ